MSNVFPPRCAMAFVWLVIAGCHCSNSDSGVDPKITGPHELHVVDSVVVPIAIFGGTGPGLVVLLSNSANLCQQLLDGWHPKSCANLVIMLQEAGPDQDPIAPTPGEFEVSASGREAAGTKLAGVAFSVTDALEHTGTPSHASSGFVRMSSLEPHEGGVSRGEFQVVFGSHTISGPIEAKFCPVYQ